MKFNCLRCGDEWEFCEEDYESQLDYPLICPLCKMPLTQMIKDVYTEEGTIETIKRFYLRVETYIKIKLK